LEELSKRLAANVRNFQESDRGRHSWNDWRDQAVMRVLARCHRAFEDVADPAVLTLHVLVLRSVMTVRQTAHARAFGSVTIYATGQQSKRSSEHRDDHENSLDTAHR